MKSLKQEFEEFILNQGGNWGPFHPQIADFFISKLTSLLQETVEEIEGKQEEMKNNAMIRMGDLSFLNYTPTGIYNLALSEASNLIKEKLKDLSTPLTSMK